MYKIHLTDEDYLEIIEMHGGVYEYVDMEKNNGEYFSNEHALNKLMGFYKKIVEEHINEYYLNCNDLSKYNLQNYDDCCDNYDELVQFYIFISYVSSRSVNYTTNINNFEQILQSEIIDEIVIKCCRVHFKNCIEKIRVVVYDFLPKDIANICIEYTKE